MIISSSSYSKLSTRSRCVWFIHIELILFPISKVHSFKIYVLSLYEIILVQYG